jgi:hypothetical protein
MIIIVDIDIGGGGDLRLREVAMAAPMVRHLSADLVTPASQHPA